jgi:hypothetical protein
MTRQPFALAALALAATLAGASSLAFAADPSYNDDSSRQERMDSAYDSYRNNPHYNHSGNTSMSGTDHSSGGRFERAENSVKRGAHKTGDAIKNGAHKTAEALRRTGDKIKDKTTPSN